jgi:integrase
VWVKGRSEVVATGTVEVVYRWVAAIFKAAVFDQLIASPCNRIALPKREDGEVVPLIAAQVQPMADACPDRNRALVIVPAGTGLRRGECFGLSVDRVDFLHRQVRVDRQLLGAKGGVPEFGPPKSKAGFRTVPLPDVVSTVLAEHLARYRRGSSDLIFTSSYGTPLRRNTAGEMRHRADRKAELPEWATFHDLRHFYASLLISRGCSVKTVQRRRYRARRRSTTSSIPEHRDGKPPAGGTPDTT